MAFSPTFGRTFQPTFDRRNATGGAWWNLFGAIPNANVVAAYQPKSAASLAASYINLVTPGTYNAAPGTAPTWDATNGWKFAAASTQYLTTGVNILAASWTAIVRFSSGVAGTSALFGYRVSADSDRRFAIFPNFTGSISYQNGTLAAGILLIATSITSGVLAITGANGYRDGVIEAGSLTPSNNNVYPIFIGCWSTTGTPSAFITANIQAFAIYNNDQSANMAALYTAMNAL